MKRIYFVCLILCLTTTFLLSQSNPVPLVNQTAGVGPPVSASQTDPKAQARILDSYGKLPLAFEANHGQTDGRVKFLLRTGGYSLFLTKDEAVLALSGKKTSTNKAKMAGAAHSLQSGMAASKVGGVLRMRLRNANPATKVTGMDELAGTSNYFIGNDPAKWRTNVPTYAKVKYEGIYSGIDLVYYGNQRQVEYDFIVAPGADPHRIAFDVRGAKRVCRDQHGDLVLKMGEGEIRWHKPVAYQETNGTRHEITAHYSITNTSLVGFVVAKYDASRPLYIDPLIYSTYLGGSNTDSGSGVAVDSAGNAYVIGYTNSTNFPTTNPLQPANGGGYDVFVSKINPTGSALVYSTYLGGSNDDIGWAIAVDSLGNAYLTGDTYSTDFPTINPLQPTYGGGMRDAFVAKINPAGSTLAYSTYLGGSGDDTCGGIAVDSAGNAYVACATASTNFPTMNPLQPTYGGGNYDAAIAKLNPTGSALVYSTYLGGSGDDDGFGIALDTAGNSYVTGYTTSTNFPTMNPLQPAYGGNGDAFVAMINSAGSALVYSTYLGGSSFDQGGGIAVDSAGNAYVTGQTGSANFPVTPGAFQTTGLGGFVAKLNPTGSALVYSTYLDGSGPSAIAVDSSGNAYVTGDAGSNDFPLMNPLQPYGGGGYDAFVTKFNASGSALIYSTYLGGSELDFGYGIAVDSAGNPYVTGFTTSTNFPTRNPLQPTYGGGSYDAFVTKIGNLLSSTTTLTSSSSPSALGQSVTFTSTVTPQGSGTPTGTVTFTYSSTTLCNAVTLSGGTATCAYSALPVGSDIVTATYSGDSNFSGSSASLNQTVNKAITALTLVSSVNPSGLDSPVTFTATITPQYGGQSTGTVTFKDGTTALGSVAVSGNAASLTTSGLAMGTHSITAIYSGDSNFIGSTSNTVSQVVTKATTTTTLVSSVNPSVQGKPVTFTAVVSSPAGTPTGKIEYLNGKTVLATIKLTSGSAKYTTSKLPPGSNAITAVYEGDPNNSSSTSAPDNQIVLAVTTISLTSSPNPSAYGQSVTFKAVVTSSIGAPPDGETIIFKQGAAILGTGTLSGGTASFSVSTLTVGTKGITALYSGDSNFAASTSKAISQVIRKATSTTTLTSSQNPSTHGQPVTFTATVAPEFSGTPTGSIVFKDGTKALKTVTLSGGVASYTTSTLTSGMHSITATYNGSASFDGSSSVPLIQTVN
jgi:hypothetical protein